MPLAWRLLSGPFQGRKLGDSFTRWCKTGVGPEPDERDRRWADERIADLAAAVDMLR
jgi:hypothetical protein